MKQTPSVKCIEEVKNDVKSNELVAVPFDKDVGFCVMRKTTYESKPVGLLDSTQFKEKKTKTDSIRLEHGKDTNKKTIGYVKENRQKLRKFCS